MKTNKGNLRTYHYQAEEDIFAKVPDLSERIIQTTMKQIKESYDEFMQELILEAQEAY